MESSLERVSGRPSNSSVDSSSEVLLWSYFPENNRQEETDRGEKREGRGREGEEKMRGEAWLCGWWRSWVRKKLGHNHSGQQKSDGHRLSQSAHHKPPHYSDQRLSGQDTDLSDQDTKCFLRDYAIRGDKQRPNIQETHSSFWSNFTILKAYSLQQGTCSNIFKTNQSNLH